jgi:RNA polymerase sigma-54 factor
MAIGPRLEFRQSQSLVMTPQLRQAIKLLQYSNLEAAAYVEEELERNPLLERDEHSEQVREVAAPDQRTETLDGLDASDLLRREKLPDAVETDHTNSFDAGSLGDGAPAFSREGGSGRGFDGDERSSDDLAEAPRCLRDHLAEQLRLGFTDPVDRLIGAHLITLLDPAGRVAIDSASLADAMGTEPARVERVRADMQRFDPPGLFARDLRECLAAQLADRNRLDPAMQALLDNLDLLGRREMRRLMELCDVDAEDLAQMITEIRALDPKPGAAFDITLPTAILPDVLMRRAPIRSEDGSEWILELNPETMPRVLVNQGFHARILTGAKREDRAFLGEQLSSANWLVKSLQQRAQTILKVAAEIVRRQDGFFRHGVSHLRPLILRDIADAVEMHESTVSRVTANKYIATPRGTFELKYFFTTAIAGLDGANHSAEAVRQRIRSMVGAETAADILSDDAIVAALRREGVDIARRTVAKYRDALRIPSSVQRKREKALPA